MVWLRLTAPNGTHHVLVNSDHITSICQDIDNMNIRQIFNTTGKWCFVKESLDEIEIMLRAKGEDVRRSDPRGREVIGQQHPDFQSPDSLAAKRGI